MDSVDSRAVQPALAALAAAVSRALSDPARLQADFEAVWVRTREQLSLATMVESTEAVYRKVLRD